MESLSETRSTHFASADLRQEGELKLRATAAYTDLDQTQRPGLDQRGAARSAGL